MKFFKKIIKLIRLKLVKDQWSYFATILKYDCPEEVDFDNGKSIYLKKLNLMVSYGKHFAILRHYQIASKLTDKLNAKFIQIEERLYVEFYDLKFEIQTAEELFILNEIWINGCYNYSLPADHILIDVGLNVGMASIYFASQKRPKKIYALEPFTPTFDQALRNVEMNKLDSIINMKNFGWGKAGHLTLDYSSDHKGQMGVHGTDLVFEPMQRVQKMSIQIKDPNEILAEIIPLHPSTDVVFKIDCEGAEYEIFELIRDEYWDNVKIVMLEWHLKGPEVLISILTKKGFKVFSFDPLNAKASMIYAVK